MLYIKGNQTVSEFEDLLLLEEDKTYLKQNRKIYIKMSKDQFYYLELTDRFRRIYKEPVIITPIIKLNN